MAEKSFIFKLVLLFNRRAQPSPKTHSTMTSFEQQDVEEKIQFSHFMNDWTEQQHDNDVEKLNNIFPSHSF